MPSVHPLEPLSNHSSSHVLALVRRKSLFSDPDVGKIDQLLIECSTKALAVQRAASILNDDAVQGALEYFSKAQSHEYGSRVIACSDFNVPNALQVLYSEFWQKALDLTDVLEFMPSARREEWGQLIYQNKTPEFEPSIVHGTLKELLIKRKQFLGEMVDGIFFGLSKEHVTNRPEGFSKRMILARVLNDFELLSDAGELIHDLRYVVSKLMNRGLPQRNATTRSLKTAKERYGEWLDIDGGSLRIKVFKKGTAHLEVHCDIAWQLNQILAINNPIAIPSRFRKPPKKTLNEVPLNYNLISHTALYLLEAGRFHQGGHRTFKDKTFYFSSSSSKSDPDAMKEACSVLELMGGSKNQTNLMSYSFDYDISDVLDQIEMTGFVPELKSHQYYPTPEALAIKAVDLAGIEDGHKCLEPSAGTGGLAQFMPMKQTQCVEVSKLFCVSLENKGFLTDNSDFLKWGHGESFDRIVMNPPFNKGRALAHLTHAKSLLSADGKIVAILPSSMMGKEPFPSMKHTWHGPYQDQFSGTGVSVGILVLENNVKAE